jgi:hypothetical protein
MLMIPRKAVLRYKARIHRKLADAISALEAADAKLGQALSEFDEDNSRTLDRSDITEARIMARYVVSILLDTTEVHTQTPRVFAEIAGNANENPRNLAHLEGAALALSLAEDALATALEMAGQLFAERIDAAYESPFAAYCFVKNILVNIDSNVIPFDRRKALKSILGWTQRPTVKRRLAVAA